MTGKVGVAQIHDEVLAFRFKDYVKNGHAGAGNLWMRRAAMEQGGPFPVVESGGDTTWTMAWTRSGRPLVYDEAVRVFHPSRTAGQQMAKARRFARAHAERKEPWRKEIRLLLPWPTGVWRLGRHAWNTRLPIWKAAGVIVWHVLLRWYQLYHFVICRAKNARTQKVGEEK